MEDKITIKKDLAWYWFIGILGLAFVAISIYFFFLFFNHFHLQFQSGYSWFIYFDIYSKLLAAILFLSVGAIYIFSGKEKIKKELKISATINSIIIVIYILIALINPQSNAFAYVFGPLIYFASLIALIVSFRYAFYSFLKRNNN